MKNSMFVRLFLLLAIAVATIGCGPHPAATRSDTDSDSALPRLYLHQPKTLTRAAERLAEIHEALVSSQDFPKPMMLEVVEVIHSTGASAHSHFYLASEFKEGATNEHGEGEVEESIKRHTIEVSVRMELADIAKFLPHIAANTDLGEADWQTIQDDAKLIQEILGEENDGKSDSQFRQAWKDHDTDIVGIVKRLGELASKANEGAK